MTATRKGGRRPGAGRPGLGGVVRRSVSFLPEQVAHLKAQGSAPQQIRRLVDIDRARKFRVDLDLDSRGYISEKEFTDRGQAWRYAMELCEKHQGEGGSVDVLAILPEGREVIIEMLKL